MTKRIIDLLETIRIKQDDGKRTLITPGGIKFTDGKFKKITPVAQAGQSIGACQNLFVRKQMLEFQVGSFNRFVGAAKFVFHLFAFGQINIEAEQFGRTPRVSDNRMT